MPSARVHADPIGAADEMYRNLMLLRIAPWIVLAQFPGAQLAAQVREDTPQGQARCSAAVTALESRRSKDDVINSLHTLAHCERSAGNALSRVWRAPPSDQAAIQVLTRVSSSVRDRRIMEAVIGAARDRTAPDDLRIAALTVLGAYILPHIARIEEGPALVGGYYIYRSPHRSQVDGSVPLGDAGTAAILNTLGDIAAGGVADARISGFAAYLKEWIEDYLRRTDE